MSDFSERWINIFKNSCDKESYYFSYSMDGISYQEVANASTQFLACEVASRCFTGLLLDYMQERVKKQKQLCV